MKVLSRQDLRNALKKKQIEPVYVLFGAETYLRNLAAETIADLALKDSQLREFNETLVNLQKNGLKNALSAAEQLPMMGSKRVVTISDVVVSSVRGRDTISEDDEDLLSRYLKDPAKSSVVIFVVNELDKRRKISKLLLNNAASVDFKPLRENELLYWAKNKVRELEADSDERSLRYLVGLAGNNVRKLTNEIEKLATAAMPENFISYELVGSLVPDSGYLDNFELTNQLLAKNKIGALRVLKKVLDDGAEPLMLLGLLSYNFRRLFIAKEMMMKGLGEGELNRVVRLPFNQKKEFLASARRTKGETFARILKRIAKTDQEIKTSIATPRLQIEILVCELAGV
ncbi:MAG: DNA polymerase III subunit delta [Pyrinomonadaceae bacterium]|nr:DNA polymerase III subunit delta [Pyrinomonadaceae bacterium]